MVNGLATNHALASRIAQEYISFGRVRPLDERLQRIQAVTAEDVQRVLNRGIKGANRTMAALRSLA